MEHCGELAEDVPTFVGGREFGRAEVVLEDQSKLFNENRRVL